MEIWRLLLLIFSLLAIEAKLFFDISNYLFLFQVKISSAHGYTVKNPNIE